MDDIIREANTLEAHKTRLEIGLEAMDASVTALVDVTAARKSGRKLK